MFGTDRAKAVSYRGARAARLVKEISGFNYVASTPPKPSSAPAHTTLQRCVRSSGANRVIPRFHFPRGRPPPAHQHEHALHKVQSAFATFPNSQSSSRIVLMERKVTVNNGLRRCRSNTPFSPKLYIRNSSLPLASVLQFSLHVFFNDYARRSTCPRFVFKASPSSFKLIKAIKSCCSRTSRLAKSI
ncbi:hypothetical protein EVAR_13026_1 [Eumeta japonica]|uniref:Uncharacterized protein n=1 Tax=Eumeta variegata TaxID=151549 RepID=A0A4C1TWZ2_EUMVA|nr:hypothetical protein EVAR_13026_1 [Eumeta japonica]